MTQTQFLQLLVVMGVWFGLGCYAVVRGRRERKAERDLHDAEQRKRPPAELVAR